ncbi:MAG: hypothetical protein EOL97_16035 [Spirochaetia bacterium]|nr:hypothetical protein [Spirochaetia bacterium]
MKVVKKVLIFSIVLFSLIFLNSCEDFFSSYQTPIVEELHSYHKVTVDEIPNHPNSDNYILYRDIPNFDSDTFIDNNYLLYLNALAEINDVFNETLEKYENGEGDITNPRDMSLKFELHVDNDVLEYKANDNTEKISLETKWLDFIVNGSTSASIADLMTNFIYNTSGDMEVSISNYSIIDFDDGLGYVPFSSFINIKGELDDSENVLLSGNLSVSFASRLYDFNNNALGKIGATIYVKEFDNLNANNLLSIYNIVDSLGNNPSRNEYENAWNQIKSIIWGSSEEGPCISATLYLADEQGIIDSETYSDLNMFIGLFQ